MAHRRGSFRGTRSRSLKTWTCTNDGIDCVPVGAALSIGAIGTLGAPLVFFFGPETEDNTILRTRGAWNISVENIGVGSRVVVSVGMGVINEQSAKGGSATVPAPIANADWDGWYYHDTLIVAGPDTAGQAPTPVINNRDIDSKAMRIIQAGDVYMIAFQTFNVNDVSSPIIAAGIFTRTLVKTS